MRSRVVLSSENTQSDACGESRVVRTDTVLKITMLAGSCGRLRDSRQAIGPASGCQDSFSVQRVPWPEVGAVASCENLNW